jgi:hypothetical protein
MQVSSNVDESSKVSKNIFLNEKIMTIFNKSILPPLIQTSTGMGPIIDIWTILNDTGNMTGMPERFAAVILAYSHSKNYSVAINEWSVITHNSSNCIEYCICSHKIEINNHVKNNINGNILVIGSECINKFGSGNMKTNLRIVSNIRKYTGTKRLCQGCCKHKISEEAEEWKTLCKSCYKNGERTASEQYKQVMNYKQCQQCSKFSIPKDAEDWKTLCNLCYNKNLSERNDNIKYRQCQQCKKCCIPEDAEDWKTLCNMCYNRKLLDRFDNTGEIKKIECRQCRSCKKLNIPNNEPRWKTECLDCYISKR